jgi:hypothetical protein
MEMAEPRGHRGGTDPLLNNDLNDRSLVPPRRPRGAAQGGPCQWIFSASTSALAQEVDQRHASKPDL